MVLEISVDDIEKTQKWDSFVKMHPAGTPYHLTNWIKTIKETYHYDPVMYMDVNKSGKIECVFPFFLINNIFTSKRIISLPFSDYGGPIANHQASIQRIIETLNNDYSSYIKNIEIRSDIKDYVGYKGLNYYKRHVAKLSSDEEKIYSEINKRTIQYSIRKAKKKGVRVYEDNSIEGLKNFIRLNSMTRLKHGVPSQPDKFFYNLFNNMISKKNGFILLAEYRSKIIAASVFITVGRQVHYKYNASDLSYLKEAAPNHLITWKAIQKGINEGYDVFDFGRTSPDNKGLIRYKRMWGAEEFDCVYSYFPEIRGASSFAESSIFYKLSTGVWKRLPTFMRSTIGTYIYKYLC